MGIIEVLFMGIGVAMDAFSVSICKGLCMHKMDWKKAGIIGLYFGVFQGIMPIIGYFLARNFGIYVAHIDHWITFILLSIIGGKMIAEAIKKKDDCSSLDGKVDFKGMVVLAIATSIDALAIGIMFAFLRVNIWFAAIVIGGITFVLCTLGVKIGNIFGDKYERKAQLVGGVILVLIGVHILMEHLGVFYMYINMH